MNKKSSIFLIIAIMFVAFNLRAPLTGIGPLVYLIKDDYNISNALAGFITTLPLLAFALFSPFVSKVSDKLGNSKTMFLGIITLLLGEAIRSYTNVVGLFIGTALIGLGIAIGNVVIPSIIKLNFPNRVASITGIYTPCMSIFAAISSGFSVPIATKLGFGWKNTLALWITLAFITLIIWAPQLKRKSGQVMPENNIEVEKLSKVSVWKSPLAWHVTIFMGLQSILFYVIVAWLPTILQDYGINAERSGYMTLFFQLICVPASFIVSQICNKLKDQRILAASTNFIYLIGVIGLYLGKDNFMLYIYLAFIGIGSGAAISLALSFMGLRASSAKEAASLAGMAQSIGYLMSAFTPSLIGSIYDKTHSFNAPLIILIIITFALFLSSFTAGANKYIK